MPATTATWIPIALLGRFTKDGQSFTITDRDVEAWKRDALSGRVPLDVDHRSAHGDTRAMGWITNVRRGAGKLIEGLVEWTPAGRAEVESGAFKFCSVEFVAGVRRALRAVSLTNKPFLPLPAIALSETPGGGLRGPWVRLSDDAASEPLLSSMRLRDLHDRPGVDPTELRAAERAEAAAEAGGDYVKEFEKALNEMEER